MPTALLVGKPLLRFLQPKFVHFALIVFKHSASHWFGLY